MSGLLAAAGDDPGRNASGLVCGLLLVIAAGLAFGGKKKGPPR